MSKARMEDFRVWEDTPRLASQRDPEDIASLALAFYGMAPLFLHVVLDPFELRDTSVQRKVLVEALELPGEVALLIASSPVAVTFEPC